MIFQYRFQLTQPENKPIPSFWAYRLYAWMLEQLSSEIGNEMHQQGERPISQYVYFDRQRGASYWVINLLNDEMAEWFSPILNQAEQINLHCGTIRIEKSSADCVYQPELFLEQGTQTSSNKTELTFLTPTAFRQAGRYVIFPQEQLLIQSLVLRWNNLFPEYLLADEDVIHALVQGVHIVDYSLNSTRYSLKMNRIPSFCGKVILESKLSQPLQELWQTLLAFAPYSGIGIKTALGMGGVCVE